MGTGGNRYGAGRFGRKRKTGSLRHIDVRRLARDKLLVPGRSHNWAWWNDAGEKTASISLHIASEDELIVSYRLGEIDVRQSIRLAAQACNYGGQRFWFQCPHCGRRAALLYLSRQVACRQCFDLAYASQSDTEMDSLWRRYHKLEARLNDGKRKTLETQGRLLRGMTRAQEGINRLFWPRMEALEAKLGVLSERFPEVRDMLRENRKLLKQT